MSPLSRLAPLSMWYSFDWLLTWQNQGAKPRQDWRTLAYASCLLHSRIYAKKRRWGRW